VRTQGRNILDWKPRAYLKDLYELGERKKGGRPKTAALQETRIRKPFEKGLSKSEIARRLHFGRSSVRCILR
jgi:DNA invertase Pin-like site-specific DNA recombinase